MSTHSDMMAQASRTIRDVQALDIVYKETADGGKVLKATPLTAPVIHRTDQGFEDEDGKFWSRAIDVDIVLADMPAAVERTIPRRYDLIAFEGEDWSVNHVRKGAGAWHLIAVRPEREELHGGGHRRERPFFSGGGVG